MEFTSFIAEFSCIGIKYSKTIPGANSKVTTKRKNKRKIMYLKWANLNRILEEKEEIERAWIDLRSWLKEAQRIEEEEEWLAIELSFNYNWVCSFSVAPKLP